MTGHFEWRLIAIFVCLLVKRASSSPPLLSPRVPKCNTTSGPAQGTQCVFPFIFRGIKHFGCSTFNEPEVNPRPWCSTQTDAEDNHISEIGAWGYCDSSCPLQGTIIENLNKKRFLIFMGQFKLSIQVISTKGAPGRPMTNDNHPIHPSHPTFNN